MTRLEESINGKVEKEKKDLFGGPRAQLLDDMRAKEDRIRRKEYTSVVEEESYV